MEEEIGALAQCIEQVGKAIDKLKGKHRKFLKEEPLIAYRGEPKDYGLTALMPSLFREGTYEQREEYLFELFSDYGMFPTNASNIEKAIETQHYASVSRMLDITFDVLVAIYFACVKDEQEDGFVYVFAFPEHYSPHSKYVEDFYANILSDRNIAYSRNFKVFTHSRTNERVIAQKGGFIFFPGKEYRPIASCYYEKVTISTNDKKRICKELSILFGITEATMFPEKDKIAEVIKGKLRSGRYIQREVSVENEVEAFFDRLDYELNIVRDTAQEEERKDILRSLRKEEDDLKKYVLATLKDDEISGGIIRQIEYNFKILQIHYKENQR